MTTEEINKRNNAILAVMGGPLEMMKIIHYNKDHITEDYLKSMANALTAKNLQYNTSWDWMIPAWSKLRHALSPGMIISAISFIDEAELENLWKLLSQVAMTWCKENNINFE